MRPAAALGILACGMSAALWLRLAPGLAGTGVGVNLVLAIGLAAGSLLGALAIRRFGHKPPLVAGLALLTAAWWCLAYAPPSRAWMAPLAGALGLGGGMAFLAANAAIGAAATGSRATALALLNLPLPAGFLIGPLLSTELILRATAVLAAMALAAAVATSMPPQPGAVQQQRLPATRVALLLFLYALCEGVAWSCIAPYLMAARVLDPETAWAVLLYGLPAGLIVGRAGCSRILVNVAPLTVARVAGFALMFAMALLLLARSPSASWIACFVVGVAMAPLLPSLLALPGDALAMGIALAAGWIGLAAGSPLIAWIADRSSLPSAMLLLPLLALAIGMAAWDGRAAGDVGPGTPAGVR